MEIKIQHQTYFSQGGLKQESWGIMYDGIPGPVFYSEGEIKHFLDAAGLSLENYESKKEGI